MTNTVALLNVTEAAALFGVHTRTILRKIKDNSISDTQVVRQGRETKIYVQELIRIFGEPPNHKNNDLKPKIGDNASHDTKRQPTDTREHVTYSDPRDAHIATLREQLTFERERAERERMELESRLEEAGRREREERERAERYERDATEQRRVAEALMQKLLEPPKPRGFLARMLGR